MLRAALDAQTMKLAFQFGAGAVGTGTPESLIGLRDSNLSCPLHILNLEVPLLFSAAQAGHFERLGEDEGKYGTKSEGSDP